MTEPAPGRFSTTTDLPSRSDRGCASARQIASTAPPAGHGAIRVICRAGKSCAPAGGVVGTAAARPARTSRARRFMVSSLLSLLPDPDRIALLLWCQSQPCPRPLLEQNRFGAIHDVSGSCVSSLPPAPCP